MVPVKKANCAASPRYEAIENTDDYVTVNKIVLYVFLNICLNIVLKELDF